jgi:hypothetical protein
MATITGSPATEVGHPAESIFLGWIRKFVRLVWPPMDHTTSAEVVDVPDLTLFERVQKFLWLASGLFSAASFAIPAIGFLVFDSAADPKANFLAAVVSACLFGVTSVLHFGPDEA